MAALDKRTILSSKRARNKRKKAQRSTSKALTQLDADQSGELTPTDGSSGDEAVRRATRASAVAQALTTTETADTRGDDDDEDDDDEEEDDIVLVCRPTMQDFCVEYVASAQPLSMGAEKGSTAWADLRKFTVRIPAFRETRDGYTTYSIMVTTAGDSRKQYQLERRYSEFVAFALALDEYLQSPRYQQLRGNLLDGTSNNEEETTIESSDNQAAPFRWELPPKTWFRVTQTTALEDRRSKLEASLQALLAHEPHVVCQIPHVRDFLMLDIFGAQVVEEKLQRV